MLVLAILAIVSVAGSLPVTPFDSLDYCPGPIGDFTLTDQDGKTVTRTDLLGKVWVASFIFTRCPKECVEITKNLGELQRYLGRNEDVMLVSFTVDPENDMPSVLKGYAQQKGADPERWIFLTDKTGKTDVLYPLIVDSFKQGVRRAKESGEGPEYQASHSSRLIVVDAEGEFRGYVDGTKPEELPRLREKIRWLVLGKYHFLPTVNGALNGLSGLLLVLGFVAIRNRLVTLHKTIMWTALGVSTLFLACYLYYHFAVLGGRPTGFPGEGWIRPVYFGVLISHTLLAAVVAPLAVFVAYRGVRGHLARHVRLARWTLPLWLYVSVTGVLVYWMRYHLYP
jgi:protein SCO1/2/putative membrane protein